MRNAAAAIALALLASCTEIEAPTPARRAPSLVARFPIGSAPSFGVLAVGDARVREIVLENAGDAPLQVELPTVEAPFFLDAEGTVEIGPATTITRTIRYQPLEAGEHALTLTFGSNGGEATLILEGQAVEMPFHCTPETLDFGTTIRGRGLSGTVTCESRIDAEQVLVLDPLQGEPSGTFGYGTDLRELSLPAAGTAEIPLSYSAGAPSEGGLADRGRLVVLRKGTRQLQIVELSGRSIPSSFEMEPPAFCDRDGNFMGAAGIGIPITRTYTLRNRSADPLAIDGLGFPPGPFSVTPTGPQTIPPGGSLDIEVTATPDSLGTTEMAMRLETDDPLAPTQLLCFRASGAGPSVSCDPMVDFGATPRHGQARATLNCTVAQRGSKEGNYRIRRVETDHPAFEAWLTDTPPASGYPQDTDFTVELVWTAGDGLEQRGELRLIADDLRSPQFDVPLRGSVEWPGCTVSVYPNPFEFGFVEALDSQVRNLLLENESNWDCWIESASLRGSASFALEAPPTIRTLLRPGEFLEIPVRYSPLHPAFAAGELGLVTSDQNFGERAIPVEGFGAVGCILVGDERLDFEAWPGCPAAPRELVLTNQCSETRSATLRHLCLSSRECEVTLGAETVQIAAGATERVPLRYQPSTLGQAYGLIAVVADNADATAQHEFVREFHGESATGEQRDVFPQEIEGTRIFPLSSLALDVNGDGWVDEFDGAEVRIDDVRLAPVDALGRTWSVRADVQELVFREDRVPAAGSEISIEYVLACTQP